MLSRNGIYELREDIAALVDSKDSRNKQNVVKVAFGDYLVERYGKTIILRK